MNKWLIILLSLLCIDADAQQALYSKKLVLSERNFADSIGIEWERNQVYVPVQINGRNYRFLLDTGAAQSVVYADTPIDGCQAAGYIRSHDATGAMDTVPMVILPPMTLGRLTISRCQATIQQRPIRMPGVDGILGFNLINSGLLAKIDVHRRLLIITDRKKQFKEEKGIDMPYKLRYHVPYLDVNPFGRYHEMTLFDTGSRRLYVMNRSSFDRCADITGSLIDTQVEGRSMGRHAIGHFGVEPLNEVVFLCLSNLHVGRYTLHNLHTLTSQGESHLGAQLLTYGAMIINPKKKRITLLPYNGQQADSVNNRQLDIAFVSELGRPCVGLVWEQGEPYRLGFRQGDIITKIDDSIVRDFSQFISWPFIIGREYRFTVRGLHGETKEIRWVRIK